MANHFHLALETPQANLVAGMKWLAFETTYAPIRRGWFLGSKDSRREFLLRFAAGKRRKGQGEIWREVMEERAELLVGELLKRRKWDEGRLKREKKGHAVKVEFAKRLRKETTMSVPWIAKRLWMGSPNYLYTLLYQRNERKGSTIP
jgi:hypothetical protein